MVDDNREPHDKVQVKHPASNTPTLSSLRADLTRVLDQLRSLNPPEADHLWRKLAVRDIRQAIRWIDEAVLSSEEEGAGRHPR